MPFEIYRPDLGQPRRKQGPAKLTVLHSENGRSQITLSAGTRDWLRPTPGDDSARWPGNMPTMKLIVLVHRDARKLMLQRCADNETGEHVYEVRGLNSSGTAYITGWKFDEALDIEAGHYFCELIPDMADGSGGTARAVTISTDAGVPPKKRRTSAQRTHVQQHAAGSPAESTTEIDQQRIDEIRTVLDEGVTVVEP
ncbi:hypothetical protein ACIA78_21505 [Streptomyces xanthochromogenes]|uniref:hypothetical protein n=1 Tax=Streptomyces xanthochromogenes TaxID=67384 RepID=UPI0037B5EA2F